MFLLWWMLTSLKYPNIFRYIQFVSKLCIVTEQAQWFNTLKRIVTMTNKDRDFNEKMGHYGHILFLTLCVKILKRSMRNSQFLRNVHCTIVRRSKCYETIMSHPKFMSNGLDTTRHHQERQKWRVHASIIKQSFSFITYSHSSWAWWQYKRHFLHLSL